jgi:hypothetical protein
VTLATTVACIEPIWGGPDTPPPGLSASEIRAAIMEARSRQEGQYQAPARVCGTDCRQGHEADRVGEYKACYDLYCHLTNGPGYIRPIFRPSWVKCVAQWQKDELIPSSISE